MKEQLITAGLTDKEATVLLHLYKFGLCTALEISKSTKISKISVLYVLERLVEKDLVDRRTRYNTYVFQPKSPTRLLQLLDRELLNLSNQRQELEQVVASLQKYSDYQQSQHQLSVYLDLTAIKRLRAGLMDLYTADKAKKTTNYQTLVEFFETDRYLYLVSVEHKVAIRFSSKAEYEKVLLLFENYLVSNEQK